MPCHDHFGSVDQETIDKLTRFLCYLCDNIWKTRLNCLITDNDDLFRWWMEHKEADIIIESNEFHLKINAIYKDFYEKKEWMELQIQSLRETHRILNERLLHTFSKFDEEINAIKKYIGMLAND